MAGEVDALGAEIILSNTFHLFLAPGSKLIKKSGGLHKFMDWSGPILTDSGGFQVFSLSKIRKINERGVTFADPVSGQKHLLTPEKSIKTQAELGVDIAMAFDDVIGYPARKDKVEAAMERTSRWASRCLKARGNKRKPLLFGIVQGGIYKDLRIRSAKELTAMKFDGYAVGGVAVGEPREKMKNILEWTMPLLPESKPRYLMGLGRPEEIVAAVKQGIDMFDCVIPTREARHGRLYLFKSESLKGKFYETINISNSRYRRDLKPINSVNLKRYSRAYLHHLFKTNEPLGMRLATLNNLHFYLTLMSRIRKTIRAGQL